MDSDDLPNPTSLDAKIDSQAQDMEDVQCNLGSQDKPAKGSFKEVVANSTHWFQEAKAIFLNSMDWEEPEVEVPKGDNVVLFSNEKLHALRKPWSLTLMGKCLGISVRPSFMTQRIRVLWKPRGTVEVIDLGKGVFLFRFSLQDDYERALFGGPWYVLDHYLMINRWKPNFRPTEDQFDKLAIWVHFPELPVEYYDKEALHSIASKVGKPIRVDYATNNLSRARYARVCVEISLEKPILTRVWVMNHWQPILYENLHTLCFHCGRVGHQKANCSVRKEEGLEAQSDVQGLLGETLAETANVRQVLPLGDTPGKTVVQPTQLADKQDLLKPSGFSQLEKGEGNVQTGPRMEPDGPWTVVVHRKKPNYNINPGLQMKQNKGKAIVNHTSSVAQVSRKIKVNQFNSNGASTSNYWRSLETQLKILKSHAQYPKMIARVSRFPTQCLCLLLFRLTLPILCLPFKNLDTWRNGVFLTQP